MTAPLVRVDTQKQFMDALEDMVTPPKRFEADKEMRGHPYELKSYLIENNTDHLEESFAIEGWVGRISNTGIDKLKILTLVRDTLSGKRASEVQFYLDMSDKRFLLLHTNYHSNLTKHVVTAFVDSARFELDRAWFSGTMLKNAQDAVGNRGAGKRVGFVDIFGNPDADELVPENEIMMEARGGYSKRLFKISEDDPEVRRTMGYDWVGIARGDLRHGIKDEVNYNGRFTVKKGRSVGEHMVLVDNLKDDYVGAVKNVESYRIDGYKSDDGFSTIKGTPFEFEFTRNVEDWQPFLDRMFDAMRPFRIWGVRTKVRDGYHKVLGVDMHTGHRLDIELTDQLIRVYLPNPSCGNVIMRMFVNLQRAFDATAKCKQISAS
jgi:hypothetical protein